MFGEDPVVVWVSSLQRDAFLDLMATVCYDLGLDEVLPDVPEDAESKQYIMIRRPTDTSMSARSLVYFNTPLYSLKRVVWFVRRGL